VQKDKQKRSQHIKRDFRKNVLYEEIYEKYHINQKNLITILKRSIKGNFDYEKILSGGIESQKQFNLHLDNRWNPLNENAPFKHVPIYLNGKEFAEDSVEYDKQEPILDGDENNKTKDAKPP
jgi:hypothetical protein